VLVAVGAEMEIVPLVVVEQVDLAALVMEETDLIVTPLILALPTLVVVAVVVDPVD